MKLNKSVTIKIHDGNIVLNDLDLVIFDHPSKKTVLIKVHPLARLFPLWKGQEYDKIGDYTQTQLEDRLLEILGDNIEKGLQDLMF
jgi:hypothetical protein